MRLLSDRTQMTSKLRPNLKLLFFVIALLFLKKNLFSVSKIVLVGVQEGSRYASSAVSALKRLGARNSVLGSLWYSFAFVGYAGIGQPAGMTQQKIPQGKTRLFGPSQITLKIPLSSSKSSQYNLLHLWRRYLWPKGKSIKSLRSSMLLQVNDVRKSVNKAWSLAWVSNLIDRYSEKGVLVS